jgi:hypothetical protein
MTRKLNGIALAGLLAMVLSTSSGCFWVTTQGPNLGFLAFPIPISPYFQEKKEEQHWEHERYNRVPILGPITSGTQPVALDPPSDDEVMATFEHARPSEGGFPMLYEVQRNNIRIVKEKIADYVDPPRVYPLIGPAQQHHAHYKCTVYFEEVKRIGWPVPYTTWDQDASEVVYIDHNHLHMVGNVDPGAGSNY